jgi:glutamate/tyrosine decarboxylase-like PLP-dependent enzyme
MLRRWNTHATHPRYLGLFSPCPRKASLVADALLALYNPQLASWNSAPFANELERFTLRVLAGEIGFDIDNIACHFTSGGQESNFTAVVAALTHAFPGYGLDGLRGLHACPVFYLSEQGHGSFDKIAHTTGLGRRAIRRVATNRDSRLDMDMLADMIARDRAQGLSPFLVVGTVGTTAAGAIDPLGALSDFCGKNGLWFHVDAAWGGSAVLTPMLKQHLEGIEKADSLSWDAAKWLSVSMGAGMFFSRHPTAVTDAFRVEVPYATHVTHLEPDGYKSTMQWSRRFIGLKVFLTLAEIGLPAMRQEIEHMCHIGNVLRQELIGHQWKIVNQSHLPLVCFTHALVEQDRVSVQEVLKELYRSGDAWISSVLLHGKTVFRACITNHRTSDEDIRALVGSLNQILTQWNDGQNK